MVRRNPLATLSFVLLALGVADLMLMVSGYRILVGQQQRHEVVVEGHYSALNQSPEIATDYSDCSYFTGRSVRVTTFQADAVDECPFVFRPSVPADAPQ